jgi:hypothetical protein
MAEYTRPINYITMVEVLKNGPPHRHIVADLHELHCEAAIAIRESSDQLPDDGAIRFG